MSRWPFILVFGAVFLAVTGVLAWGSEVLIFRWVGRSYRLKHKQIQMRSLARVNGRKARFMIQALRIGGIGLAMYLGICAGVISMAWALEVFE